MQSAAITPDSNHAVAKRYAGFSVYEDGSAAALVIFRKLTATGDILGYLQLAADEGATLVFPHNSEIDTPDGVYVEESSGSITGVLYHR